MDYHYEYSYAGDDELGLIFLIIYLLYYLIMFAVSIASYVMGSLGFYTIASRRGIAHPWLAWIPVANSWIVGSISDQYRYVTRGQIKNKRKILVILNCATIAVTIALYVFMIVKMVTLGAFMEEPPESEIFGFLIWLMVGILVILGLGITTSVFHYMAMYDLYAAADPIHSVTFLVVSIFFSITQPFFVFFNRKKDLGMPPRMDEVPVQPVYLPPQQPVQEPWTNTPQF